MTKNEIALSVAQRTSLTPSQAREATDALFAALDNAFANHHNVFIRGFGTFQVVTRAPKKARNIIAGTFIQVPARDTIKFKPSNQLKMYNK